MNASEIEFIEARLPVALQLERMPSPEEMQVLVARAHRERNEHLASAYAAFVEAVKSFARVVRRIAASCTEARLHSHA